MSESATPTSGITRAEVAHLARLAGCRWPTTSSTASPASSTSSSPSVARVAEVATADIPPTSHPLPLTNVIRPDDEVRARTDPEEALAGAPAAEDGRFRVPRILDEEA